MNATDTSRKRGVGTQVVTLLLIVSFAFIPVRCDASAAPHSIFVSANMADGMSGEMHDHAMNDTQTHTQHMPGHDPQMAMAMTPTEDAASQQTPQPSSAPAPVALKSALQSTCLLMLVNGSDPESQQPVGATLDLPPTSVTPSSTTLAPLERAFMSLIFPATATLAGLTVAPEAPPPKAS